MTDLLELTGGAMPDDIARLAAALETTFDLDRLTLPEEYRYASLPLCVIDAVFSIGVTYASTKATVARWCERQGWPRLKGEGGREHSLTDFLSILNASDPDTLAAEAFGNRQRTSATSGILKAEAVRRYAEVLIAHGVHRLGDTEDETLNARVRADILKIPGQGSGLSFDYFLMLTGSDAYVKADRMVCRFIASALGRTVAPPEAALLLKAAADVLLPSHPKLTPRLVDYAVWERQRAVAA